MATTGQDAKIYRGANYEVIFELLDEDDYPLDPAGTTLHYRVARAADAPEFLAVDDIAVREEGDTFLATVTLSTELTKDIPSGSWYHELYQEADGERTVLATGILTVTAAQAGRA